jgi:hypothetical protein
VRWSVPSTLERFSQLYDWLGNVTTYIDSFEFENCTYYFGDPFTTAPSNS